MSLENDVLDPTEAELNETIQAALKGAPRDPIRMTSATTIQLDRGDLAQLVWSVNSGRDEREILLTRIVVLERKLARED